MLQGGLGTRPKSAVRAAIQIAQIDQALLQRPYIPQLCGEFGQNFDRRIVQLTRFLKAVFALKVLQRSGSVREKIDRQGIVFRWALYFLLIFAVIVFGKYGPDYDPADFIYRGF